MAFDPEILSQIQSALEAAAREIAPLSGGRAAAEYKSGNQLVTRADRIANRVLREILVGDHEGWLSEESADDLARLKRKRVWIVDPVDGTGQFVAGIPEWSISIALVEDGQPVAGGICNPATKQTFVGSLSTGVTCNGKTCHPTRKESLDGAVILASRDEFERGEWDAFNDAPFRVKPVSSIAFKLALVAAGLADATWTLQPKHEWDVAGGVALIRAGGGFARCLNSPDLTFNHRSPRLPNLVAAGPGLSRKLPPYLNRILRKSASDRRGSIVPAP